MGDNFIRSTNDEEVVYKSDGTTETHIFKYCGACDDGKSDWNYSRTSIKESALCETCKHNIVTASGNWYCDKCFENYMFDFCPDYFRK